MRSVNESRLTGEAEVESGTSVAFIIISSREKSRREAEEPKNPDLFFHPFLGLSSSTEPSLFLRKCVHYIKVHIVVQKVFGVSSIEFSIECHFTF